MGAEESELKLELTIPLRIRSFGSSLWVVDSPWLPGYQATGPTKELALSAVMLGAGTWLLQCAKTVGADDAMTSATHAWREVQKRDDQLRELAIQLRTLADATMHEDYAPAREPGGESG